MQRETTCLPYEGCYRFFDVTIRIQSDSHQVAGFLRTLYSRFLAKDTAVDHEIRVRVKEDRHPPGVFIQVPGYEYLVFKTGRGFVLSCQNLDSGEVDRVLFNNGEVHHLGPAEIPFSGDDKFSGDDLEHIRGFVQMALLRTVSNLMPHRHLLHAAAAAWKNQGIILAAASGHGKTMLSLALVKQGFKFLSDDVGCLDLNLNRVEPFPRRLNLRRTGLGLLRTLLPPDRIGDIPGKSPMDIDELLPASLGHACPLGFVFLLEGKFQAAPELKPVPKRQALWRTLKLSHTPVTKPADALWKLSPVFDRARCYELKVGELNTTAELIRRQVESATLGDKTDGTGFREPARE